MKKVLFIILFTLGLIVSGFAGNGKTKAIKGQVIDGDGSPIIGAKVQVKGLGKVVYTDFDGEFLFPKVALSINLSLIHISEPTRPY